MRSGPILLFPFVLALSACHQSEPTLEGRALIPPREGIKVGSLYFVREAPTADLSRPADLERLCEVNLDKYDIHPSGPFGVADIDFARSPEFSATLSGLQASIVSAGLTGSFSDYYEYKLVNAKRVDISFVEAERLFASRAFQSDCTGWRRNIGKLNWGKYQILGITYGDINFGPKRDIVFSPEISAKIASLTPKLAMTLKSSSHETISGKALVISFSPLLRDN